jgi:hypothetical protein
MARNGLTPESNGLQIQIQNQMDSVRSLACSSASRALLSGGSGFAAQGSGRALALVHLVAPSLCPENPGPGLCFLPRNFPGWLAMESCLAWGARTGLGPGPAAGRWKSTGGAFVFALSHSPRLHRGPSPRGGLWVPGSENPRAWGGSMGPHRMCLILVVLILPLARHSPRLCRLSTDPTRKPPTGYLSIDRMDYLGQR